MIYLLVLWALCGVISAHWFSTLVDAASYPRPYQWWLDMAVALISGPIGLAINWWIARGGGR